MPDTSPTNPVLERFVDSEITTPHLLRASQLFSEQYGVWGPLATTHLGPWAKAGKRVAMSPQRLKRECLATVKEQEGCLSGDGIAEAASTEGVTDVHNEYVRAVVVGNWGSKLAKDSDAASATDDDATPASLGQPERQIVGHVLATRWRDEEGRRVCWITQVVVHREWRRRGIATAMLRHIATESSSPTLFGVLSSHAATLRACVRAFTGSPLLEGVDKPLIRALARPIMAAAPVKYVREAKPRGSLFVQADAAKKETDDEAGAVASAFTNFFVDHAEPDEARAIATTECGGVWPLGELDEGCEFLVLCWGSRQGDEMGMNRTGAGNTQNTEAGQGRSRLLT